jgi:hypothetical protein
MRGGRKPSAAGQEMVGIACVGPADRQTVEHVVAITAVARKLAGILHRMWVSETDFHVGFGAKVTQRLRLKPVQ